MDLPWGGPGLELSSVSQHKSHGAATIVPMKAQRRERWILGWTLSTVACEPIGSARPVEDSGQSQGREALVVSPGTMDFGTISVIEDGSVRAEFTVTNAGTETIAVHGHDEILMS